MKNGIHYINTETLNSFFEINLEGGSFGVEFRELTWECDNLNDFVEGADEGACYKDLDGEIYFKIRNKDDDCEVFYFLNDSIKQL